MHYTRDILQELSNTEIKEDSIKNAALDLPIVLKFFIQEITGYTNGVLPKTACDSFDDKETAEKALQVTFNLKAGFSLIDI